MRIAPEFGDVSIVLIGSFNPAIFTPDWFLNLGLISKEEFETVNLGVVHKEITKFDTEWFELAVEREKFSLTTEQAPWVRVSDLVVKIFEEQLPHTPLTSMGINRSVHFQVGGEEKRNALGMILAPHQPWGKWAEKIEAAGDNGHGGMRVLIMEQSSRDDGFRGKIQCRVSPSSKAALGVYVSVNDHIDMSENDSIEDILGGYFDQSIANSENIIDQLMKNVS